MDAWEFEEHARTLIFKAQGIVALLPPEEFLQHFIAPSQIEMRRAISSAYYAVFHQLTTTGALAFAAGGTALCQQAARAYNHSPMRKVCDLYARLPGMPIPPPLAILNPSPPDPRLIGIAKAFAQLQDGRHLADYDLSATILFENAAQLVTTAGTLLADRWTRRG